MAKKKKKAHEHHGGAWKVAYGDFITSMMALFMVLWILTQDVQTLEDIADYFRDPYNAMLDSSPGIIKNANAQSEQEEIKTKPKEPAVDVKLLTQIMKEFFDALNLDIRDEEKPVEMKIEGDAIFITIFDRPDRPVFVRDTTQFTDWGNFVMEQAAWLLGRHQYLHVRIDAHIPKGYDSPDPRYGGWELTADMANAVRRALEYYMLDPKRVYQVTGYSDTKPLAGSDPESISNQRIELELSVDPMNRP